MTKIVKNSEKSLRECAEHLRSGKLVSFPTETVYGLGASLWQEEAIRSVFETKKRPMSDPLIVHVGNISDCQNLVLLNEFQNKCFYILAEKFWPGPLTMVVSASAKVPKSVTAGSPYVGIRIPSHSVAQELLNLCQFPVAAPSANTFGHVSPTSAQHVFDDLKDAKDLYIIEHNSTCEIGIESTVIKIAPEGAITLLRPGMVSFSQIEDALRNSHIVCKMEHKRNYVPKEAVCKNTILGKEKSEMFHVKHFEKIENVSRETFFGEEAPGQSLTHYSPWMETHILITKENATHTEMDFPIRTLRETSLREIKRATILDFGKKFAQLKHVANAYIDLSESGNFKEAAHNLFQMLRKSEQTQNSNSILIAYCFLPHSEMSSALFDRIYRSASGKFIQIADI